jgi:hypothetical protein
VSRWCTTPVTCSGTPGCKPRAASVLSPTAYAGNVSGWPLDGAAEPAVAVRAPAMIKVDIPSPTTLRRDRLSIGTKNLLDVPVHADGPLGSFLSPYEPGIL